MGGCVCTPFRSRGRSGLQLEDARRKSLAEKGWARRSVVVHGVGPGGAANLEQLPCREDFEAGSGGPARPRSQLT